MKLPPDYLERVYAGVLGKIIGVYLGRPIENMLYRDIIEQLGPINYYVHEQRKRPLIVTDDDITGTFVFVKALADSGRGLAMTAADVGEAWLNYIIYGKTILWWGGIGNSTEHTAFIRLRDGIPAPRSGSMELNSKVVAEQIGAQIFIDAWPMLVPGRPDLAVELARKAASVSHDGEAIYAAQVVAAIESQAFVESDINRLLDVAVSFIPNDSVIYRMISDLRAFRLRCDDWTKAMTEVMEKNYGYDKYGGNCHVIPNHGLIILALLWGDDDFQKSLMIGNTCGWDTDCNSANIGCILAIKNGLRAIDSGPDWRGPVADRMYLPTADGGCAITDAAQVALSLVNTARKLAGEPPQNFKGGARYHFELPGSLQGWKSDGSIDSRGVATVDNVQGHSVAGTRSLAIRFKGLADGRVARVTVDTFTPPEAAKMEGYALLSSPTIYSGQKLRMVVLADPGTSAPVTVRPCLKHYTLQDTHQLVSGPPSTLKPGEQTQLKWTIPDLQGMPIGEIGLEILGQHGTAGVVYLDSADWTGEPQVNFTRHPSGYMWLRQWIEAVDRHHSSWGLSFERYRRVVQDVGVGMIITGTREWRNYSVSASIRPHLAKSFGVAVRVQGLKRHYSFTLAADGHARLTRQLRGVKELARKPFRFEQSVDYLLRVEVSGATIRAFIGSQMMSEHQDEFGVGDESGLTGGGVAIVVEEGRIDVADISVAPLAV